MFGQSFKGFAEGFVEGITGGLVAGFSTKIERLCRANGWRVHSSEAEAVHVLFNPRVLITIGKMPDGGVLFLHNSDRRLSWSHARGMSELLEAHNRSLRYCAWSGGERDGQPLFRITAVGALDALDAATFAGVCDEMVRESVKFSQLCQQEGLG